MSTDNTQQPVLSDFDAAKCASCGHMRVTHGFGFCDECPDEKCECKFVPIIYAGGVYSPEAEREAYRKALRENA